MSEPADPARGRGRGRGRHGGRGFSRQRDYEKPKNLEEAVPIMKYGQGNDWVDFKKRISLAACKTYGDLGRLVNDDPTQSILPSTTC